MPTTFPEALRIGAADRGDVGPPVPAHALIPVAAREIHSAHVRQRRDVHHEGPLQVGQEQPLNEREIAWHVAQDLNCFEPFALGHELTEMDAGGKRDREVDEAREFFR